MNKQSQHQAGLVLLWSLSLLVGWRPLAGAFALAWRDDQYTHILLILPISAALIFMERRSLRRAASLLIHAVAQAMHDALHHNPPRGGKSNAQNHVALNFQLPGFTRVLRIGFGDHFEIGGYRRFDDPLDGSGRNRSRNTG